MTFLPFDPTTSPTKQLPGSPSWSLHIYDLGIPSQSFRVENWDEVWSCLKAARTYRHAVLLSHSSYGDIPVAYASRDSVTIEWYIVANYTMADDLRIKQPNPRKRQIEAEKTAKYIEEIHYEGDTIYRFSDGSALGFDMPRPCPEELAFEESLSR